jgi:hypothetical protein
MTVTAPPAAPSVSWTARVPHDLAEQVEAAMPLLGLTNRTEAVVAALRLLRRHAREAAVLAAIDAEYGPGGVVPAHPVTAGMDALVAAGDAAVSASPKRRPAGR